ncbi:MAG: WecB/TagA/CpsF family glycosyltransferase [Fusicatenibacter sp.]|nr:WecB/TagA/CpsF family glycosyltransferase [Lachnospiraceae bacterium]MDY2937444.1 WecB/TagA/CpsF family glycosyltransferase [Fusicatenibacter sp.]
MISHKESEVQELKAEIEILGVAVELKRVDAAMSQVEEYLKNDKLNTIGVVTMQMLMQANKDERWKKYISDFDMTVICETEVLDAAGVEPEEPVYEEVETNEFIARLFWYLIQKDCRVYVLGDTESEARALVKYLMETYPGIQIEGSSVVDSLEESDFDSLVNEINSNTVDIIVSGLAGTRQDQFVLENSSKINAKIWFSLGEHPSVQNDAGIKTSWWGNLLKKNTFKRMVTKYNSEKEG